MLICYTERRPEVEAGAPHAVWVDVSADKYAYWRVLQEWWAHGESFAVVEHDVIARPDIFDQFAACPEPWCLFPYDDICHWECMEAWANALGCTRFSAELIRAVPDAVTAISHEPHQDWHNVCDGIGLNLRAAGFKHHWHYPAVFHHAGRPEARAFYNPDSWWVRQDREPQPAHRTDAVPAHHRRVVPEWVAHG